MGVYYWGTQKLPWWIQERTKWYPPPLHIWAYVKLNTILKQFLIKCCCISVGNNWYLWEKCNNLRLLNLSSIEDQCKFKGNILLFKGLHGMSFTLLQDRVNFHAVLSNVLAHDHYRPDTKQPSPVSSPSIQRCNTRVFWNFKDPYISTTLSRTIFEKLPPISH